MTSGFLNTLRALFTSSKPTADDSSEDLETEPPFDDAIVLPLEDHIDLHPFAPRDIPSVVEEYLEQCLEHGFVDVRIIHGRGQGVQRRIVRSLLTKHARVTSFKDAPPELGGWGATLVTLVEKRGDGERGRQGDGDSG